MISDSNKKFIPNIMSRRLINIPWLIVLHLAVLLAILALFVLIGTIINSSFGFVLFQDTTPMHELLNEDETAEEISSSRLKIILRENLSKGILRRIDTETPIETLSHQRLLEILMEHVIQPHILKTWTLSASLFARASIQDTLNESIAENPLNPPYLQFRSWVNADFLTSPQSAQAHKAGIFHALLGSLWMMLISLVIACPIGIGTAIFIEEYLHDSWFKRFIQVNIYNLAGVPSIIYGLLGLTVFVRFLEPITAGRTIISAGATLALLILPIIIINTQEAIQAVPKDLRYVAYAIGATKWQTIWSHIIPYTLERILTGTILASSRAIGETAPLVVVGAATFITTVPSRLLSQFTALPIQIYQWSARPQAEFFNIASAAIIVLLILMLLINITAILLRNALKKKKMASI